jgi:hypothetical protein
LTGSSRTEALPPASPAADPEPGPAASCLARPLIMATAVATIMSAKATSRTVPGMNSAILPPA